MVPYRSTHCHCNQMEPTQDLLLTCSGGQPWRRYKEATEQASGLAAVMQQISADKRRADVTAEADDFRSEITKFRKKFHEEKLAKEKEKQDALKRLKVTVTKRKKDTPKSKTKAKVPKLFGVTQIKKILMVLTEKCALLF